MAQRAEAHKSELIERADLLVEGPAGLLQLLTTL